MGFDFLDFGFPKSGTDWKSINGKPEIIVSTRGISNGLSYKANDGADFGVDTTLGATSPSQTGAPYTTSGGILEAWNYAVSRGIYYSNVNANGLNIPQILLKEGVFHITGNSTLSAPDVVMNPTIRGINQAGTWIEHDVNSGYAFTLDPAIVKNGNLEMFGNCTYQPGTSYTPAGLLSVPSTSANGSVFSAQNLNISHGVLNSPTINLQYFVDVILGGMELYGSSSVSCTHCSAFQVINSLIVNSSLITYATNDILISNTWGDNFMINVGSFSNLYILNTVFDSILLSQNGDVISLVNTSKEANAGNYRIDLASGQPSATIGKWLSISNDNFEVSGLSSFPYLNPSVTINATFKKGVDSHYTNLPHNTPSTPTIPASATAQSNTNPYPVNVYLYGGTVTEIQITKNGTAYTVFSNATGLALSGQVYKLNPSDSITITYTSAPTWDWLSD